MLMSYKLAEDISKYMKIFGKAQVDLTLGLGTLLDNNVYSEVEPEFQELAYFATRIGLQNTTQSREESPQNSELNESLTRLVGTHTWSADFRSSVC